MTPAMDMIHWTEGMLIQPAHLQYLNRCVAHQAMQTNQLSDWGWEKIVWDAAKQAQGILSLSELKGCLPNGLSIDYPQHHVGSLEWMPDGPHENAIVLYIGVKRYALPGACDDGTSRYEIYEQTLCADALDHAVQELDPVGETQYEPPQKRYAGVETKLATLKLYLLSDSDDLSGYDVMPIVKVARILVDGQVLLDEAYVPPCAVISAHPKLAEFGEQFSAFLSQKRADIIDTIRRLPPQSPSAHQQRLLLSAVTQTFVQLSIAEQSHVTPRGMDHLLRVLLGQLSAVQLTLRLDFLSIIYQHNRPMEALKQLLLACESSSLWHTVTQAQRFSVEQTSPHYYRIYLPEQLASTRHIYVCFKPQDGVLESARNLKLIPYPDAKRYVQHHLPGLSYQNVATPPIGLPVVRQSICYRLETSGELWEIMCKQGGFCIYLGSEDDENSISVWGLSDESTADST